MITCFPIFDISIRSADIHDQSPKLSEIVPNFGRFLPSQILGGGERTVPKLVVPKLSCLPRGLSRGKVS